ncbi:MAG: DUF4184 family protein [Thermoplasmata archaeon]|nr:MAG: DUF4184 family protein [Thermoplasmata archaeon]
MPITPLHIGIPGIISYLWPKRVDIFSVIIGCIIIDLDFLLFLLIETHVHGYFHTFVGATLTSIVLIIIIHSFQKPILKIKKWFKWESQSTFKSITYGALIGTYSHVIIDSFIYEDMNIYYPMYEGFIFLQHSDLMFILIYFITAFTTALFLTLYIFRYISTR